MPIIPRYQARGGPSVGGLNYASAYSPAGGDDWRMLGQVARAGGAIVEGIQALRGRRDPAQHSADPVGDHPDMVSAKAREVAWRRNQLEQPNADLQAVARSRDAAGQDLPPAARATFDRLTGPREAGYAAAAASRAAADLQAMSHRLSEDREALGLDEYVLLADSAPDQARAALGSAIGELTSRLGAMGASEEAVEAGRRGLLGNAVGRRIRQALVTDPERALVLLEREGSVLDPTAQTHLRMEVEAEQTRLDAQNSVQRLATEHEGLEDDLEGLLVKAETLAGPSPDRIAAYRGAAVGAWRGARLRREAIEDAAWGAVEPYLDPQTNPESWTAMPGEVWTALSARQRAALRGHFETPWKGSDPAVVQAIETTALGSTEVFAEIDLTGMLDRLSAQDFTRLRRLQRTARIGGQAWEQERSALSEMDVPGRLVRASWNGEEQRFPDLFGRLFPREKEAIAPEEKMIRQAPRELDKAAQKAFDRIRDRAFPLPAGAQIDWDYILGEENGRQQEGGPPNPPRTDGYIPVKAHVPKDHSSVTIASGVDIGQKSLAEVEEWNLAPGLLNKLKPYIGAKGRGAALLAENKRKNRPLKVTPEEARQIDEASHSRELNRLVEKFDAASTIGPFASLPKRTQTVLLSVYIQHGT
ncbi:MAG: hypothetical protein EOP66_00840, partial [Sphingomonas sp.]